MGLFLEEIRTLKWEDFSQGWCPSDDERNGALNRLLKMENVTLDKNGALTLGGGCAKVGSPYSDTVHSLFPNDIDGIRADYANDVSGNVYRNRSILSASGSTSNMGFSTAFNYSLIASGNYRVKDSGSGTPVNLGVGLPTGAPTPVVHQKNNVANRLDITSAVDVLGPVTHAFAGSPAICRALFAPVTIGGETLTLQTYQSSNGPIDLRHMTGGSDQTDNDITFLWSVPNPAFSVGDFSDIDSITIDVLLTAPGAAGKVVSDYFSYTWQNDLPDVARDYLIPSVKRSDFLRIGTGTQDWSTVYGYRITVKTNNPCTFEIDLLVYFVGGVQSSLTGQIEYLQINVNNTGNYLAKSPIASSAAPVTANMNYFTVTPSAFVDTQVNEVWIFRRGGLLDQWYRVKVLTSSLGSAFDDTVDDLTALDIDVTLNTNLISIASSGVSDAILAIVGPMEGRWYYFTNKFMYPSDINNPDLVDSSIAVRITGSNDELFMWAFKITEGAILIGTSHDVYLLTGTFVTLPDNSVDIYLKPLSCKHPPIQRNASFYNGRVFYLALDGWRAVDGNGQSDSLVAPNTDRIYQKSANVYGYTGPTIGTVPNNATYANPITIANNRLYAGIGNTNRIEVYDFTRKYWRVINYNIQYITAIATCPDGNVTAFYAADSQQRDIDIRSSLLIDGTTKQVVTILSKYMNDGLPENRKDVFTLKAFCNTTGSETINCSVLDDLNGNNTVAIANGSGTPEATPNTHDFPLTVKSFQFSISGQVSVFTLAGIYLNYTPRPTQVTRVYIRPNNYGTNRAKLLSALNPVIDTLGGNVTYTPKFDGTSRTPLTINTNYKKTNPYLVDSHTYVVDVEGVISGDGGNLFEYYGELDPDILDILPPPRRIYQVGPIELFRYGKLSLIEIRAFTPTTPTITILIEANNDVIFNEPLQMLAGKDSCAYIPVPKGMEGQVIKVLLSSDVTFYPYYIRLLVSTTGKDTEKQWITLPETGQ